jgi:hypothetical protein
MAEENKMVSLDSLSANEFRVEIDGTEVPGIFRVSGLRAFDYAKPEQRGQVTITKMVERDPESAFNLWLRETIESKNGGTPAARTVEVVAVDDGVETRRWVIEQATLVNVSYSDFNSAATELIEEIIQLQYRSVSLRWSAGK